MRNRFNEPLAEAADRGLIRRGFMPRILTGKRVRHNKKAKPLLSDSPDFARHTCDGAGIADHVWKIAEIVALLP
jgi:hypothetical protein